LTQLTNYLAVDFTSSDRSTLTSLATALAAIPTSPLLSSDSRLNSLANLDATVSSRLATGVYSAPPTVGAISTQVNADLAAAHGAGSYQTATGFATPGAQMDLVSAPNSTAIGALQASVLTAIAAIPAPPTAGDVAQAILQTDLSTVEGHAPADSLCTVCLATLHSSVAGTTWTIRKTDGTTMVAKTVAVSADAAPIVGVT
jgi:hypothetical protein